MDCTLDKTTASDKHYLIDWALFNKLIVSSDIEMRNSKIVNDHYISDWFYFKDSALYFNPPAIWLHNRCAYFINGRHRMVLLSRHHNIVPVAITKCDADSKQILEKAVIQEVTAFDSISLPSLEIKGEIKSY